MGSPCWVCSLRSSARCFCAFPIACPRQRSPHLPNDGDRSGVEFAVTTSELSHKRKSSPCLESSVVTSRRKRAPRQVHGIEQELRFKRLTKMCGLPKSVLLVLK